MKNDPIELYHFTERERALLAAWDERNVPPPDDAFKDRLLAAARNVERSMSRPSVATSDHCSCCEAAVCELAGLDAFVPSARRDGAPVTRRALAVARVVAASAIVAAAVIMILLVAGHRATSLDRPVVLALGDSRAIEGRVSWPGADRHRPYRTQRGGPAIGPASQLRVLAELESRGDFQGIAAAYLLGGQVQLAKEYLARARPSPAVRTDQAVAELVSGNPLVALNILDEVLRQTPGAPQALWNRALALRDLGLLHGAARAFDEVAALHEAGWSEEAARNAAAAHRGDAASTAGYRAFVARARATIETGSGLGTADVAERPGLTRAYFYDAVRCAPSRERALALLPLAQAIDNTAGDDALESYVQRVARSDFGVRAGLAARYAAIVAGQRLAPAVRNEYLQELRRAHASDILLGALVRTGIDGRWVTDGEVDEYLELARGTGDSWFELYGIEEQAESLLRRRDFEGAEIRLLDAMARCRRSKHAYRCTRLERQAGGLYLRLHRVPEAKRALDSAMERARREQDWTNETELLAFYGELFVIADHTAASTLGSTRAYFEELGHRRPDACSSTGLVHIQIATQLVNQGRYLEARDEIARFRAAGCADQPPRLDEALVHAALIDAGIPDASVARVESYVTAARANANGATSGDHLAFVDYIEGVEARHREPARAQLLFEHAVQHARAAGGDPDARVARNYSYGALMLAAGRRGDAGGALSTIGAELGSSVAARCVLGVGGDSIDPAIVMAARGARGTEIVHVMSRQPGASMPSVPSDLIDLFAGCDRVEVLASAPMDGTPRLLPRSMAWSYRVGAIDDRTRQARDSSRPRAKRVVVSSAEPPDWLGLPRLIGRLHVGGSGVDVELRGSSATPARVLAEIADATVVEIDAHGLVDAAIPEASFLALTPDADGSYALTAGDLRGRQLLGAPLVILAACRSALVAPRAHEAWSLPAAFVAAGARAVIAAPTPIDDLTAEAFFHDLQLRVRSGVSPALALRDTRMAWPAAPASWFDDLIVFE